MSKKFGVSFMLACVIIVVIDGVFFVGDNCWGSCQVGHSLFAILVLGVGFAVMTAYYEPDKVEQIPDST